MSECFGRVDVQQHAVVGHYHLGHQLAILADQVAGTDVAGGQRQLPGPFVPARKWRGLPGD